MTGHEIVDRPVRLEHARLVHRDEAVEHAGQAGRSHRILDHVGIAVGQDRELGAVLLEAG